MPFACLGFVFLGPGERRGVQEVTERVFERAQE